VSFVINIIDIGVCSGFWKTRKMEKCILSVCSLQTSATRHCRKTKLFEYSVTTVTKSSSNWAYQPTHSKLNSSVVYRCYVKQLRVYSNSFRHANFVIHWFLPGCYCVEQCGQTTFDQRAILKNVTTRGNVS